ncbi:MAG: dephospho-CoA kinase [Betaproteobacteria bacterium]|nr:dephospho-CoA kinase [Betaproteobacteria bacterium]
MQRVATIGLTGGIGSGKSTAAQGLVALGAHLVDTDAIARALTLPGGAAVPALADEFGADALTADGALDREKMRRLVFADPGAKARLETILHPLIGAEARRRAAASGGRPVVFDVPLLTESSHWRARVDRVLVIDCDEATQAARVAQRPGWTEEAARRVIAQQAPRAARRASADAVICNEGLTIAQFQAELRALWALWFPTPGGSG